MEEHIYPQTQVHTHDISDTDGLTAALAAPASNPTEYTVHSVVTADAHFGTSGGGSMYIGNNVKTSGTVNDSAHPQWRIAQSQSSDLIRIDRSPTGATWTPATLFSLDSSGNPTFLGLAGTGSRLIQASSAGVVSAIALTGLLKVASGVPSAATAGTDYYNPGGTDVAVADGGTGASTASGARTNLGLVIGTNVQAWDTDLDTWATKTAPSGTVVGDTDAQTLTSKTLGNTNTVTLKDTLFTLQDDGDATKQAQFQLSSITAGATRTLTIPDGSGTICYSNATSTFSAVKTFSSAPVISTITNTGTLTLPTSTDTLVGRATTDTLTNKRVTKRSTTTAGPGATPTINSDNVDYAEFTALAAAITSMTTNLTGTPARGDTLWISFTDNGTARAITWGAKFEASTVALPTTTVISTRLDVGFTWNVATSKWRCVAVA